MSDLSTIFTIASAVLTVFIVLVVLLKTRGGIKRGAYRQPIHLAGVLLAAIISFAVTTISCTSILKMFDGKTMSEILAILQNNFGISITGEYAEAIGSFDANLISYLLAVPLAFISPIIFFIIYIVAAIIIGSARATVIKFCKIPRRVDTAGKTVGGVLGALEGVLVMAIMLLPVTAMLRLGVPIIEKVDIQDETISQVRDGVVDVYESPAIRLVSFAGGDFLANELSTVKLENSKINLTNEINVGFDIAYQMIGFMEDGGESITPEKEESLRKALDLLEKSDYLPILLSGAMNIVADKLDEFMPDSGDDADVNVAVEKLSAELGGFLRTSTADTVVADIKTFLDLYLLLGSDGTLDKISNNPEDAFASMIEKDDNGKTLISKMIDTLSSNERTKPIISTLNELSVSLMLNEMGVTGDTAQVYDELKTGINNVIKVDRDSFETEDEYKEELKTEIKGTVTTTLGNIIDGKIGDKEININISEEDKNNLQEIKDKIENGDEDSDKIMTEVADKVDEFLRQNPEIATGGELDDAEILDFITSNFGDIFAEGGFSGFGGTEDSDSE